MHPRGEALREYLRGALWVLPGIAVVLALVAGSTLSHVRVRPHSPLHPLAFAGTADDARQVLIAIASTMVTVIALVLGLTVVALQVASTQFSPRLLRNFLRDRPNQVVLAVFVATFAYSTAGLYTVGVSGGGDVDEFPRIAVTGAIVLVFVSLGMLVFFVHHVAHSIQIDTVMTTVARTTARGVLTWTAAEPAVDIEGPAPPPEAVVLTASRSGYLQTAHPERLLAAAQEQDVVVSVLPWVGDHVVANVSPLALVWRSDGGVVKSPDSLARALRRAVQLGPERTLQQDTAFGMRQLVDIALRTLSPAINDPYSAVQVLDRLSTVVCLLGIRASGDTLCHDPSGTVRVVSRGPAFADHLDLACGQIRRYGAAEPAVCLALLRMLGTTATVVTDPLRREAIAEQARLVLLDAEARIAQPADLTAVRALGARLDLA
ncbi:DUF2254 domain-containing protein [Kitasatospora atroaurantiaca]|uniref:Putative membrane protein n=1 Tax=Kitasatospora atroaurantiaca TaxID=285545 RepID=A0A561EQL8_9ACTN|nr:DUF2254 domain-containing protein [Kitasatospora atroaurantiaca]TWE17906.1 putative membrane protein [Kitasatospora atroaurantiaca]